MGTRVNYLRGSCAATTARYARPMTSTQTVPPPFGELLRDWRGRRRLSQLDLAAEAEVSSRHISFIESGRSQPSRDMVLRLAERLDVPLRERNALLVAAGFAPVYAQRPLDAPEMSSVREAIELVLFSHEPYPAIAVDRYWNVVRTNATAPLLLEGVSPELLGPRLNVYRVSLHPDGLAGRVENFEEYAGHLLERLRRDIAISGDPELIALLAEVEGYGTLPNTDRHATGSSVVMPMRLRHGDTVLNLFTTIAVFGTPIDITVAELAIESFFPGDEATAEFLGDLAAGRSKA
jgi:transcriptional regulator with XRE-family HTH domain